MLNYMDLSSNFLSAMQSTKNLSKKLLLLISRIYPISADLSAIVI